LNNKLHVIRATCGQSEIVRRVVFYFQSTKCSTTTR